MARQAKDGSNKISISFTPLYSAVNLCHTKVRALLLICFHPTSQFMCITLMHRRTAYLLPFFCVIVIIILYSTPTLSRHVQRVEYPPTPRLFFFKFLRVQSLTREIVGVKSTFCCALHVVGGKKNQVTCTVSIKTW